MAPGAFNVRIGGPNVAGDVARWVEACNQLPAGRTNLNREMFRDNKGYPFDNLRDGSPHQSANNCGLESARQAINELRGKNISELKLMNRAIDAGHADWRDDGDPEKNDPAKDPHRWRIDSEHPAPPASDRRSQLINAGGTKPNDLIPILQDEGVAAEPIQRDTSGDSTDPGAQTMKGVENAIESGSTVIVPCHSGYDTGPWDNTGNPDQTGGFHIITIVGMVYDDRGVAVAAIVNDTAQGGGCGKVVPIDKISGDSLFQQFQSIKVSAPSR